MFVSIKRIIYDGSMLNRGISHEEINTDAAPVIHYADVKNFVLGVVSEASSLYRHIIMALDDTESIVSEWYAEILKECMETSRLEMERVMHVGDGGMYEDIDSANDMLLWVNRLTEY